MVIGFDPSPYIYIYLSLLFADEGEVTFFVAREKFFLPANCVFFSDVHMFTQHLLNPRSPACVFHLPVD